jgi:hypothetical protein
MLPGMTKVTNIKAGGADTQTNKQTNKQTVSASRLKLLNTLYTSSLKLIGLQGNVTAHAQKRSKLSRRCSCRSLWVL